MGSIVCVGSMAFDSIETPFGKAGNILGGSANYFALAASRFAKVKCVSIVGEDYPNEHLELLKSRGIDTSGIKVEKGKTFQWSGRYSYDMNEAHTLETHLNVLEKFEAVLPESYQDTELVFLGNSTPTLQMKVLSQVKNPKFIAIDTMNLWIENSRDLLIEVLSKCHALVINEAEVRQLTQVFNLVQAARCVRNWGPQILVVKRGEYGAVLFDHGEAFSAPGLPLAEVKDPTGAGDSFAGGFMGYLASQSPFSISRYDLRKAVIYGCAMASFTVQDFGFTQLLASSHKGIEERYQRFVELTRFHIE